MNNILDGKACSQLIKDDLKAEVDILKNEGKALPCLAIVTVGEDDASKVYVNNKKKACEYIGYKHRHVVLSENVSNEELLAEIDKLNEDKEVHGIIVQLPLPKHINTEMAINKVYTFKDVDGFTAKNLGMVTANTPLLASCTPMGVMALLEYNGIDIAGKNAVVIGRSVQVGKPMAQMLLNKDATVTVCHSKTPESQVIKYLSDADIVVSAVGKAKFIANPEILKRGAIIIDIGINRDENGKLCGDFDQECYKEASYYTPVPGGVGPMTVAILMINVMRAYQIQENI